MKAGLFDVLRGRFADGRRLEDVDPEDYPLQSILSNLSRLFNTRRESVAHLPDYGLPDIAEIYRDMPHSVTRLQQSIKETVEKYEPRLRRVRIEHQQTDAYAMRLEFMITGELVNRQRVRLQTTFSSDERARVQPARQPG
jgi:type VI secretion system protein